jgi:hypothetical protein
VNPTAAQKRDHNSLMKWLRRRPSCRAANCRIRVIGESGSYYSCVSFRAGGQLAIVGSHLEWLLPLLAAGKAFTLQAMRREPVTGRGKNR